MKVKITLSGSTSTQDKILKGTATLYKIYLEWDHLAYVLHCLPFDIARPPFQQPPNAAKNWPADKRHLPECDKRHLRLAQSIFVSMMSAAWLLYEFSPNGELC
jgi:hypothetical protein